MKKFSLEDIKILPKVTEVARQIHTKESHAKAVEVLAGATVNEGCNILDEAKSFLIVLLRDISGKEMVNSFTLEGLREMVRIGKEVGDLAGALGVITSQIK